MERTKVTEFGGGSKWSMECDVSSRRERARYVPENRMQHATLYRTARSCASSMIKRLKMRSRRGERGTAYLRQVAWQGCYLVPADAIRRSCWKGSESISVTKSTLGKKTSLPRRRSCYGGREQVEAANFGTRTARTNTFRAEHVQAELCAAYLLEPRSSSD